MIEILHICS